MALQERALSGAPAAAPISSSLWLPAGPNIQGDDASGEDEPEDEGDVEDIPRSGVSTRGGLRPGPPAEEAPPVATTSNQGIADTAMQYLGAPYAWAGNSPRGFDCSGFVQYVYRMNGLALPRDIAGMIGQGQEAARDSLEPGDVIVFMNTFERGLSHVGIYLEDDRFIHSVSERRGVGIDTLAGGFWADHYYSAMRF